MGTGGTTAPPGLSPSPPQATEEAAFKEFLTGFEVYMILQKLREFCTQALNHLQIACTLSFRI